MSELGKVMTIDTRIFDDGATRARLFEAAPDMVDVWSFCSESSNRRVADFSNDLSIDEKERAARFVFEEDRKRFISCRWALRSILAKYVGEAPASLGFSVNEYGKPFLSGLDGDLQFSLSHSREAALVAVTRGRRVGIDIEFVDPKVDIAAIAGSLFSDAEAESLLRLPKDLGARRFFLAWTRKEAFLKALGSGFSAPAAVQREFNLLNKHGSVRFSSKDHDGPKQWTIASLPAPNGYVAALAVGNDVGRIRYLQFSNEESVL